MSDEPRANRLLLPFVAVCILCAAEAVVIAFLFGRSNSAATPGVVQARADGVAPGADAPSAQPAAVVSEKPAQAPSPGPGSSPAPGTVPAPGSSPASESTPAPKPSPAPAAPRGPVVARGKVGQRVESSGFAITVLAASNKPRFDIFAPQPDETFVDCDVLLENAAAKGLDYFSNEFKIQDDQSRVFNGGALGVGDPQLGYGTIVQGNKVRGHVAFIVPRDAKGLTLTYPIDDAPGNARAIHIDLGQ